MLSLPAPAALDEAAALLDLPRHRRSVRRLWAGRCPRAAGGVLGAGEVRSRAALPPERLARNLARLDGFRAGVGAIVIYEDRAARDELVRDRGLDAAMARSFAEQRLGIAQLALWLALTAEGLATSPQHWDALLADELARSGRRRAATAPGRPPDRIAARPARYDEWRECGADGHEAGGIAGAGGRIGGALRGAGRAARP